jgi:hypothetical protein
MIPPKECENSYLHDRDNIWFAGRIHPSIRLTARLPIPLSRAVIEQEPKINT